MQILVSKGATADTIEIRRSDGSAASTSFPHKGPVPHDVVHFFVELELGIDTGFWGLVAGGSHPEAIGAMAKAAGHASAARPSTPDPALVPAIQAERIVECFEADLWAGGSDPQTFQDMVEAGCQQSLVPTVAIDAEGITRVREQLAQFRDRWAALPIGGTCSFEWPEERSAQSARKGLRSTPFRH
jgi:hypothetical protein